MKKPSKKKKDLNSFNKDQADVLAASARGSYFKQQKLIALDEEGQNRLEKASWVKIEGKVKDKLTRVVAKVGRPNNCCG